MKCFAFVTFRISFADLDIYLGLLSDRYRRPDPKDWKLQTVQHLHQYVGISFGTGMDMVTTLQRNPQDMFEIKMGKG